MVSPPKRIIFVGPGGVGKTTLARQVAKARSLVHFDLDEMFCAEVQNIRLFIRNYGYSAYTRRNGELLLAFLENSPIHMVLSLSSGILSEDMVGPMRSVLLSAVKANGAPFLVIPHTDDENAAQIVAARQIRRGFNLESEPERMKYLRRIIEYRRLGFPQLLNAQAAAFDLDGVLKRIDASFNGSSRKREAPVQLS